MLNKLSLDVVPDELLDLRPLEQRLISRRIVFMKLVALPKGGQKSVHGPAVNVPSRLDDVCGVLPRIPKNAHVVSFKLKRKLVYKGHHMHEYIRPLKVMRALRWLKHNNELYKDIRICETWEQEWQHVDNEFWTAIVQDDFENEQSTKLTSETNNNPDCKSAAEPNRVLKTSSVFSPNVADINLQCDDMSKKVTIYLPFPSRKLPSDTPGAQATLILFL